VANPVECLLFPFKSIIADTNGYKLSEKLMPLTVSDLFEYHPVGHFLKAKVSRDLDYEIRFVAQKYFKATSDERCTTHPFFFQCLFPTSLNLFNPSDIEAIQSPLEFRSFKQGLLIQAFDPDNFDRKTADIEKKRQNSSSETVQDTEREKKEPQEEEIEKVNIVLF
jgi:hypothetical protein